MWASTVLSRRAKALVMAVVARTLGCPLGEPKAARLLLAEGLERPQIEEILAHLASLVLDPIERIVVPFARETVWYEPVQIQRRGREVMRVLSRDQFIELIAVASIGNTLCRLGIVAAACE